MIAVLKKGATDEQRENLCKWFESIGLQCHVSKGEFHTIIGLIGDVSKVDIEMLESLSIPDKMPIKKMSKGTKEKVQLILTMSRRAKLYLLDEPIAGVDPAARDYILRTIISNYAEDSLVIISTHLIADVESVLDEAVFIREGHIVLHKNVDEIREETGMSVDGYFREVFRC